MSNQKTPPSSTSHVVDFSKKREEKLEEKRRKNERIFFKQILGIYTVVGKNELRPVEIVDVSEDGCSFQVPYDPNTPWPKGIEELPLRLYFTQDTYLPIQLQIQNSRPLIEEGNRYVRYGCSVDKTLTSYPAYQEFVRFLQLYSLHAHKDEGNATLFYL